MSASLDMPLEDLISKDKGKGKGKRNKKAADDKGKAENGDKTNPDAKLDMSLDDLVESQGRKKGKGDKSREGKGKGDGKGKGKGKWEDDWKPKGKGKGKSSKGKWDDWRDDGWSSGWGDSNGHKGGRDWGKGGKDWGKGDRDSSWGRRPDWGSSDWDDGKGDGKGYSDRGYKRRAADDWEESAPQRSRGSDYGRPDDRSRGGDRWAGDGYGAVRDDRDMVRSERVRDAREPPRQRQREAPRGAAPPAVSGRIRVANIPKGLDERDIKEAFADTGRVRKCMVQNGVAFVTFDIPSDAKRAVQTFDQGEMNGKTIFVTHD